MNAEGIEQAPPRPHRRGVLAGLGVVGLLLAVPTRQHLADDELGPSARGWKGSRDGPGHRRADDRAVIHDDVDHDIVCPVPVRLIAVVRRHAARGTRLRQERKAGGMTPRRPRHPARHSIVERPGIGE